MTVPRMRFTFWKAVFVVIMVAGIYCTLHPLLPRTGRLHQSVRPVSLGNLDRL